MSVFNEERLNISLSLNNSIVKVDTPVKIDDYKSNTYSRLEKAASYDEHDREELDWVSSIIDETRNCDSVITPVQTLPTLALMVLLISGTKWKSTILRSMNGLPEELWM